MKDEIAGSNAADRVARPDSPAHADLAPCTTTTQPITVHPSVGETPIPHGEWRNSIAPWVATSHQSQKRGETTANGKRSPGNRPAQPPWVGTRTCNELSSRLNWPTGVIGQTQNGYETGQVLYSHLAIHPNVSGRQHGPTVAITDGRNGKTMQMLSPEVDTVSRRLGRMLCMSRMAEEAKAGGNAPDMLTSARQCGR
jgi:hypothetical protein